MGKNANKDKPKFDLITASKTRKYKVIVAVVLVLGVLLLGGGLLMRMMVTPAVTPNGLEIDSLSGLRQKNGLNVCTISIDQTFVVSVGRDMDAPLVNPITFTLDENAKQFMEVWDIADQKPITEAYYAGVFQIHIKDNAPTEINGKQPTGNLTIRCGSYAYSIDFTYHYVANVNN